MIGSFLQGLVAFMIVLGPLVLVHEAGHFLMAKAFGIGVPVFSIGFGPRLVGFRWRRTDYRISAFPLGGYVRLTGDESDENRTGSPEEFLSRPKWQRLLVFVAGPACNVLLAILTLWALYGVYGKSDVRNPDDYPVVMGVEPGSAAERAGFARGDRIVQISGHDVRGLETFREITNREIVLSPGTTKEVLVERGSERVRLAVDIGADPKFGHGLEPGWFVSWGEGTPMILDVNPDGAAAEAGLATGDLVVAADGHDPVTELALRQLLEASPGRSLALRVEREGRTLEVQVVPRAAEDGKGRIGAVLGPPPILRQLGPLEALGESLRENKSNSLMLFQVLKRLVTREVPLRSVSGPIGIAQFASRALETGLHALVWMMGFFSLQLGILNLLPIPVLDGGHILILLVEAVIRRELSDRIKERVIQAGLAFLLVFMSVVIYLDFVKL
jgi:regulator of sigma E protease